MMHRFFITSILALTLNVICASGFSCATEPFDDSMDRIGPLAQATAPDLRGSRIAKEASSTTADEGSLLEFVELHQPALVKLLKYMKKKQPQQYEQALRELTRVKQRLNSLEKRDAESYAIELELWQVRSKLRMLVAEILASDKSSQEKLRGQLHGLVEKEIDLDLARLQLEQQRIEQRLSSVQSQLNERTSDRAATLSKAIKTWENRAFKPTARPKKQ